MDPVSALGALATCASVALAISRKRAELQAIAPTARACATALACCTRAWTSCSALDAPSMLAPLSSCESSRARFRRRMRLP